ncbi:hypothetical protein SAMN05720766_10987 [Fibrobacter sp. UWH9]|uniref:hypothetical protein n=1 Tax=Fibrobacter sp. UWH9 TaxID=1896213 RepID=UPI000918FE17|nr:hypothetical protein [Fibrobacter sp. UWH9]SHH26231.1 hypothetical protein SAMN05720766_10987 [Fibrobacter sp. UWH9]
MNIQQQQTILNTLKQTRNLTLISQQSGINMVALSKLSNGHKALSAKLQDRLLSYYNNKKNAQASLKSINKRHWTLEEYNQLAEGKIPSGRTKGQADEALRRVYRNLIKKGLRKDIIGPKFKEIRIKAEIIQQKTTTEDICNIFTHKLGI